MVIVPVGCRSPRMRARMQTKAYPRRHSIHVDSCHLVVRPALVLFFLFFNFFFHRDGRNESGTSCTSQGNNNGFKQSLKCIIKLVGVKEKPFMNFFFFSGTCHGDVGARDCNRQHLVFRLAGDDTQKSVCGFTRSSGVLIIRVTASIK